MANEIKILDGVLVLTNPITVDGEKVTSLKYDANEITGAMFAEAQNARDRASGSKSVSVLLEVDHAMHLFFGYAAIKAVNPSIDYSDLERLKGADTMKAQRIGRNFIFSGLEATSSPDSSDDFTENTGEHSTPPNTSSKK